MSPDDQPLSYSPEWFRQWVEEHFYALINAQASIDQLITDPNFRDNRADHPAFYADHGVVHVRDVALQVIHTLKTIHGVVIPRRPEERLEFMKRCAALLAYLHDVGMIRFSRFGRATHPEFAAQFVLRPAMDAVVDRLWQEDLGGMASHLKRLAAAGALDQPPATIFREILAMSICHSKSKVKVDVLNDPAALRRLMQQVLTHDLCDLYHAQHPDARLEADLADEVQEENAQLRHHLSDLYGDFEATSYRWLVSDHELARALVVDVVDTLRALRCADALRQRGTVLKTSGNYEIFVDNQTGDAIIAIRKDRDQLFMVRTSDEMAIGEANLASSELTADGDLRIAFHRGRFASEAASEKAAHAAAFVIDDVQSDIIASFQRADDLPCEKSQVDMRILLEAPDEATVFASHVANELIRRHPPFQERVLIVPSLQAALPSEVARYLAGEPVPEDTALRQELLNRVGASGQNVDGMNLKQAFEHVRIVHLQAGERLVEAGAPSGFVYIPTSDGLTIHPLGGYPALPGHAWAPIGSTGVIRGALRNATVLADKALSLLMIPKLVYLQAWHRPYTMSEFLRRIQQPDVSAAQDTDLST